MPRGSNIDPMVLEAALVGLQHQRAEIEAKMAEIRRVLGSRAASPVSASVTTTPPRAKRQLSAAARKRIAEAQKKRWAGYHAAKEEPAPAKKKRKISAAGRKRIAQATKKRWAAFRATQAAAAARKPKKGTAKAAKKPAKQAQVPQAEPVASE